MKKTLFTAAFMLVAAFGFAADAPAAKDAKKPVTVAYVTNNVSDFWQIAKAGVQKAEKDFGVKCEFRMPDDGTAAKQQSIVDDLIAKGIQGMAISPIDPPNQTEMLNNAAAKMPLICHDSDAKLSKRLAYVGTDNFKAGQEAGKLIKEVLPKGGKIVLFVGSNDAQNAIERSGGIKDALKGSGIEILDTRTDGADGIKARSNAEDTITKTPDISCLVGLYSYNGPAIFNAVKASGKKIPIVCFDEEEDTLQGIQEGYIYATIVQQPFEFGYQAVRVLTQIARGEDPQIPAGKVIDVPVRKINKDNVKEFREQLKALRGK